MPNNLPSQPLPKRRTATHHHFLGRFQPVSYVSFVPATHHWCPPATAAGSWLGPCLGCRGSWGRPWGRRWRCSCCHQAPPAWLWGLRNGCESLTSRLEMEWKWIQHDPTSFFFRSNILSWWCRFNRNLKWKLTPRNAYGSVACHRDSTTAVVTSSTRKIPVVMRDKWSWRFCKWVIFHGNVSSPK